MPRTKTTLSLSPGVAAAGLLSFTFFTFFTPSASLAQDNEEGFNKDADDAIAAAKQAADEKKQADKMPGEKDRKAEEEAAKKDAPNPHDPREDPLKAYYFIGLRFRDVVVPKFILNIFADGGATVNVFTFGPEFTSRKNSIEYDIGLSYADYSMNPFLFKGKDDKDDAWEVVESTLKVFYVNIDLLYEVWQHPTGMFSFMIGGGIGVGGVVGNLYRTQVYPKNLNRIDREDPAQWNKCFGPSASPIDPSTGNSFCDNANDHFVDPNRDPPDFSEPSWANGGSKPFIFPWIGLPQLSFRYKPIKELQTRADLGFSLSGFYFGLSASYGL